MFGSELSESENVGTGRVNHSTFEQIMGLNYLKDMHFECSAQ